VRILLLATAFNSLTQRIFVELDDLGYDVGCSVVADGEQMCTAVEVFSPELVVADARTPPRPTTGVVAADGAGSRASCNKRRREGRQSRFAREALLVERWSRRVKFRTFLARVMV